MIAIAAVAMLYLAPLTHADTAPTVPLTAPANTNTDTNTNTGSLPSNSTGGTSGGLVVCTGATDTTGRPICSFNYLLQEGQKIITWLFLIAVPVAMVLFAYGGILYMFGTPGNRKKANGIFTAAGIGFGIMLVAWVFVYTVVNWLTMGSSGSTNSSNNPTGVTSLLLGTQNGGQ